MLLMVWFCLSRIWLIYFIGCLWLDLRPCLEGLLRCFGCFACFGALLARAVCCEFVYYLVCLWICCVGGCCYMVVVVA